jgi:hypothetical protein
MLGLVGVVWLVLDAAGTEWDYCSGGDCVAGWKMGAALTLAAFVLGGVGFGLFRRGRHGPRSGERLT